MIVAQEQAQNLVNKVQSEMDENNANGDAAQKQAVAEDSNSETSENEEESKANAETPAAG